MAEPNHLDTEGFFAAIDQLKEDIARIDSQFPDDPDRAAEELRKLWETE
ncbi:hypothetical protein MOO44_04660 [Nicoliella spurrieriana]|uniref:Uncharacterized protein n=1 Tax=Nicoliella spurrieriana TaxID=2925830 RepID=A0A976X5Y7_9LACO|nr:hypothetical protein [Nicoliella spurrieriana]UQS87450.1 hypothetical protein MOO44_04660 [Nicoliella spurrieriana]